MKIVDFFEQDQEVKSAISIPERSEIDERYKWNPNDIFESEDKWEQDFKFVEDNIPGLKEYEGKLSDPSELKNFIRIEEEVSIKFEQLYLYAFLNKDSDTRVTKYQGLVQRMLALYAKLAAATSFTRPELLAIPEEQLLKTINEDAELQKYHHYFEDLLRTRNHTLSAKEEKILAMAVEVTGLASTVFSSLNNTDIKFPKIKDDEGNEVELSHGRYSMALESKDRDYRMRAFKEYYKYYMGLQNSLTNLFNGGIKSRIFSAKARNYNSALEAALDSNNIPVDVYKNLVKSANENIAPLHRWAELKRKVLKLDKIHPYDAYVTLFEIEEKTYTYDEGVQLVLKALEPLGQEYQQSLKLAFENRWIDVYETRGKKSGAYSSGTTYGVHPYVLLNWKGLLDDVFTLAHEMGHNMHSYYTGNNQPYVYAGYSIFLAEIASTTNEALLLDYLIKNTDSKMEKLYLLEKYLRNITTTFYRQIMFAEFEMITHQKTEEGESLTLDVLKALYKETFLKYWGNAMEFDAEAEYEWARVPHFYYNFYVYQYATGYAASQLFADKIKNEGAPAIDKYLNFLKAGRSKYTLDILKEAGIDMTSSEPVSAASKKMNELLDEVEKNF